MPKDNQRITYTTSLDPELMRNFKVYCAIHNLYQNEVIESLIKQLLDKDIKEADTMK